MPQDSFNPADLYERIFVPALFGPWADALAQSASPRGEERILDLACGTGAAGRAVMARLNGSSRVTGLDLDRRMLAVGAKSAPGMGLLQGAGERLPLANGSFDLVLCQQGLQFFVDRQQGANEIYRVLAPRGRAVVSAWQGIEHHPVYRAVYAALAERLGSDPTALGVIFSLPDSNDLVRLFVHAGFIEVSARAEQRAAAIPQAGQFLRRTIRAAGINAPAYQALGPGERSTLVDEVCAAVMPGLSHYYDGEVLRMIMVANIIEAKK